MRFLKKKLLKVQSNHTNDLQDDNKAFLEENTEEPEKIDNEDALDPIQKPIQKTRVPGWLPRRITTSYQKTHVNSATKNIVKNYSRAICNFVLSNLSKPYLEEIIQKEYPHLSVSKFNAYVNKKKDK